jgi:hypothetical protein
VVRAGRSQHRLTLARRIEGLAAARHEWAKVEESPQICLGHLLPHPPHVRLQVHRLARRGGFRFSDDRRLPGEALEMPGDRIRDEVCTLYVNVAVAKAALAIGEEMLRSMR